MQNSKAFSESESTNEVSDGLKADNLFRLFLLTNNCRDCKYVIINLILIVFTFKINLDVVVFNYRMKIY